MGQTDGFAAVILGAQDSNRFLGFARQRPLHRHLFDFLPVGLQ